MASFFSRCLGSGTGSHGEGAWGRYFIRDSMRRGYKSTQDTEAVGRDVISLLLHWCRIALVPVHTRVLRGQPLLERQASGVDITSLLVPGSRAGAMTSGSIASRSQKQQGQCHVETVAARLIYMWDSDKAISESKISWVRLTGWDSEFLARRKQEPGKLLLCFCSFFFLIFIGV